MTAAQTTKPMHLSAKERLIVALDVSKTDEAFSIVKELNGIAGAFKVGLQLFSAEGPAVVQKLSEDGHRIFLDLKFHDIPNTVALASAEAAKLGLWMFNVHACGGFEMMVRAREAAEETSSRLSMKKPLLIGVTVLTSDPSLPNENSRSLKEQVIGLSGEAARAGFDGVVASALEAGTIRDAIANKSFLIVTPGVRPFGATNDDQKRVMTPGAAVLADADHLVVGRPILQSKDRAAAAASIVAEIEEALAGREIIS